MIAYQSNDLPTYEGASFAPLRVTCELETPIYATDAPMLDSLLAAAVVRQTFQTSLPHVPANHALIVPVPLKVLWRDNQGFPLHACTAFKPVGEAYSDVYYHHKRSGAFTFTKRAKNGKPFATRTTEGRYMDRQRPLTVTVTERLEATCKGDADAIGELLTFMSAIGKERARGMGHIRAWHVESIDKFELMPDGELARNVPMQAAFDLQLGLEAQNATLGAWTPPYWQSGLYGLVYQVGTGVC